MGNAKKYLLYTSMLILMLFSSCNQGTSENDKSISSNEIIEDTASKAENGSVSEVSAKFEKFDNLEFISYCAKENTEENQIYFLYPQLNTQADNSEKINEIIVRFVESELQELLDGDFKGNLIDYPESLEWDYNNYTLWSINIDYNIKRNNDCLSVVFEGMANFKTAAHPIHYFSSLNIDTNDGRLIFLSDVYILNEYFAAVVRKNFIEQGLDRFGSEMISGVEELALSDNIILAESLYQADKPNGSGIYSFMTDTALGISIPLSFALGNHFEVMICYDDLKPFERR